MTLLLVLAAAAPAALSPSPQTDAGTAPSPAQGSAETIVVTGKPLADLPAAAAYAVTTIDHTRISQVSSGRIEDALADAAGLQLYRRSDSRSANPSADGFTLRALGGNAASRTLVLIDGVPQADPFFGSIPLAGINASDIGSIRVIRGGGSGAFGSGAVAGTIDMTSAGPVERGFLDGEVLADNRGDTTVSAGLAPRLGNGFAVVSGRWDRGPGFWTTPPGQRVTASAKARYENWSASARGVAALAPDVEIQGRLSFFGDNQTLRFKGADTGMSGEDASLRVVGHGRWQFDVLAYGQFRNFNSETISSSTYLPTLNQTGTPSSGFGGKVEVRPPVGGGHVLRLGADWRQVEGHTEEDTYTKGVVSGHRRAGGTNTDLGLYAEDAWTIGILRLTAGARADRWGQRDGEYRTWTLGWSPLLNTNYAGQSGWTGSFRGGAVVQATHRLALRGSAYTGMRQPTLNELYRSFTVYPVTTQANATLRNERLRGVEGGIDWQPLPAVTLGVTGFVNEIRNAIANITIDATTQMRQNVPAVHAHGVEFSGAVKAGTVSLTGSLAWTIARMRAPGQAYDGLRPAQTPRLSASASAVWTPRPHYVLGLTMRHVGVAFEDNLATAALPAATTLGAFASAPIVGPVSLVLRGENLTDVTVVTRNSGGTVDVGIPRTIWAGIRIAVR